MKIKKEDKTLAYNTIMLYIMMASTFIFPLITFPYLTRTLGTKTYGIVVLANAVMQYFQLFIDFGFILSGTAECSKNRDDARKLEETTSSIVYGKLILSILGLLLVCILVSTMKLFNGKEIFIILSYIPLILTAFVPDYLFRGIEKMGIITGRTVVAKCLYTAIIFIFVKNAQSFYFIPFATFLSNMIIIIWSWAYISKNLKIKLIKVNLQKIFYQLKQSSIFFASRIATTVYSASNIFVLGIYGFADAQIGIYGAANTLIGYGKSMFSPIADSLYPYMIKNKNHKMIKKILIVLVPTIIIGCIVLCIVSNWFIRIMCGKDYMDSVPYFRAMIPMLVITLPSYLYGFPMLGSINRNDKANQSVIVGAIFHFLGLITLYLTKTMSFFSIIYLTTATEILILIMRICFFNKYNKLNKEEK